MTALSPVQLYKQTLIQIDRHECRESLHTFVQRAWHIIEPGVTYVDGPHIQAICEHLQAITDGQIRFLLINIPPRHAKSTIVSVLWPCWEWIRRAQEKYLCASYSGILSTRDNLKARRLITSPWYQDRWGETVALTGDQNQKTRFENTATGYRIASSVGGTATGEGGSRLILDDPHSAQDAQSDKMRESALEWFDMVWSTRLNDPKRDAMVTIMQRLHEQDVSGRIQQLGDWEHLCLPAEWDGVKRKTKLGVYDHRTKEGELLWPERFGRQELDKLKTVLGDYGVAGQLQQTPAPAGGGILKPDRIRLWPNHKALPPMEYILQSYDTAFTKDTHNDPTACSVWGLFFWEGCYNVMLIDAWHDHLEYPDLRARVIKEWTAKYAGDKTDPTNKARSPDLCLIEKKGSGQSLLQDLAQARIVVAEYNPGAADKISRAHMITPLLDAGLVWIPESKRGDTWPTWADAMMTQLSRFPNAEHDDYCVAEGTLITMADGSSKPIEKVCAGDWVLTPGGRQQVLAAACTGVKPVYRIMGNGRSLLATGNHPVCLRDGTFARVDTLTQDSEVVCLSSKQLIKARLRSLCSTITATVGTKMPKRRYTANTLLGLASCFIGRCGSCITAAYRRGTMSITLMGTRATMTLPTWSACLRTSIDGSRIQIAPHGADHKPAVIIWHGSSSKPKHGTPLQKGWHGTHKMPSAKRKKPEQRGAQQLVSGLDLSASSHVGGVNNQAWSSTTQPSFAPTPAQRQHQNTVVQVTVAPPTGQARVYNLTVRDEHVYYANGYLTHNCDTLTQSLRYIRDLGYLTLARTNRYDDVDRTPQQPVINPYLQ